MRTTPRCMFIIALWFTTPAKLRTNWWLYGNRPTSLRSNPRLRSIEADPWSRTATTRSTNPGNSCLHSNVLRVNMGNSSTPSSSRVVGGEVAAFEGCSFDYEMLNGGGCSSVSRSFGEEARESWFPFLPSRFEVTYRMDFNFYPPVSLAFVASRGQCRSESQRALRPGQRHWPRDGIEVTLVIIPMVSSYRTIPRPVSLALRSER